MFFDQTVRILYVLPGGQVILVSLAPLLSLKSPEVHSHWDQGRDT